MPSTPCDDDPPRPPASSGRIVGAPIAAAVVAFIVQAFASSALAVAGTSSWTAAAAATAFSAASALVLLGSRLHPGATVAATVALTVVDVVALPGAGAPATALALAFAIVGAVARGARLAAQSTVLAGAIVSIAAGPIVSPELWQPLPIAIGAAAIGVCFAIGEAIHARRAADRAHRAERAERRRDAENDERARIAGELLDVLARSLSRISVRSGAALHQFDREPERARAALIEIRALGATSLDEARGVRSFLRGDDIDPATAPPAAPPQLADLSALARDRSGLGLDVTVDDELEGQTPPPVVQTTAYRIVQEALANVVRHSGATAATVTLWRDDDDLVATIGDDGTGMVDAHDGGGIRGMRERARRAGGSLAISSDRRHGTVIAARLPWRDTP